VLGENARRFFKLPVSAISSQAAAKAGTPGR